MRRYRPGELVKADSRGEFELREHDSFKINEETSFWHWKSRDAGGRSALDYLVKVEGMKFVDAVLALCEENPCYIPPPSQPEQEKEFALPPASANNRRVFAYLLKRGISRKVIEACVRAGILYESADYHNAVFVGKDEAGTARYAFLRGTYTKGKPFKAEVSGSEKQYCFCLPPKGTTNRLAVYEAAIETLAHLTLEGTADKWRLSLGGISAPKEGEQPRSFSFKRRLHWTPFSSGTRKLRKSKSAQTTTLPGGGRLSTWKKPIRQIPHGEEPAGKRGLRLRRSGKRTI